MKGKKPEEKMEMMSRMMIEMFANTKSQDIMKMISTMMPRMMDYCFTDMSPDEMISTIHEMVPKMMESCFSKMSVEQRKSMLSMCRGILDDIEKRYIT